MFTWPGSYLPASPMHIIAICEMLTRDGQRYGPRR
jgi:hypothetical protein